MPSLDVHSIGSLTEQGLLKEQDAPRDELGVKTINILYNFEVGKIYCLLDAPNKESVKKHHDKLGVKCVDVRSKNYTENVRRAN